MARWTPGDSQPIGPSEHIARRLFDEPKLFGALDQQPLDGLSLTNFEEKRGNEFSVDRVGQSSIDKKVVNYLAPRAKHAATTFHEPKRFDGWIVLPARSLTAKRQDEHWTVVPSPDRGAKVEDECPPWSESDLKQNRYHAHIMIPDGMQSRIFALLIRERFKSGITHLAPGSGMTPNDDSLVANKGNREAVLARFKSWFERIRRWLARQG